MHRQAPKARALSNDDGPRTAIMTLLGLVPVLLVSGMMLMQMLGLWTY